MVSLSGDQLLTHDGAKDELETTQGAHNGSKSAIAGSNDIGTKSPRIKCDSDGETELVEQFESGVYITYIQQGSGAKIFKRVQFR